MPDIVLKVENLWKEYRLGVVGTGTLTHDLQRWLAIMRGKEDPSLKIGAVNNLDSKGDDYVWALQDINFEVKQGEVLGIIGKNGAGKSTLLKILSKVTGPTKGQIKVKGRIASLLEVGTGFHPELTGRENIYLNGAILGMKKWEIAKKLDEIIDFSGVSKYVDTPVKRYSSGMYVRLAFAVAAHLDPEILIVDEVLAVGDADFQKKAIGKMKDVSQDGGRTVLFVSHNMLAIKSLCSSGLLLVSGQSVEQGPIAHVIQAYTEASDSNRVSSVVLHKESGGYTIRSINIENSDYGKFDIDKDLVVEIVVSSDRKDTLINVNLFFSTMDGVVIFATCSKAQAVEETEYKYQCTVPSNTLNDISYSLSVMLVENGDKVVHDIQDILTLEGVEPKRESGWLGRFPGLIRPMDYQWRREKI